MRSPTSSKNETTSALNTIASSVTLRRRTGCRRTMTVLWNRSAFWKTLSGAAAASLAGPGGGERRRPAARRPAHRRRTGARVCGPISRPFRHQRGGGPQRLEGEPAEPHRVGCLLVEQGQGVAPVGITAHGVARPAHGVAIGHLLMRIEQTGIARPADQLGGRARAARASRGWRTACLSSSSGSILARITLARTPVRWSAPVMPIRALAGSASGERKIMVRAAPASARVDKARHHLKMPAKLALS